MKKLLCLMLVAVMAIGLVACGGLKTSDLEGDYEFVKMKQGDTTYTAKDLKKLGMDMSLKIEDDGTGTFKSEGTGKQKMKFNVDKMTVKVGKEVNKFTYDDGTLVIKDKDNSMELKKK